MVLLMRTLLVKLGLQEANSYAQGLPTEIAVEILSDYLDLNYRKKGDAYLFLEGNMFLYECQSQILVGSFDTPSSHSKPCKY